MITRDDMIDRFGEVELAKLTDRSGYKAIDDVVLNRAISDAEAEVNSYLSVLGHQTLGRIAVVKPKALVIKTCDIARYYLYENKTTGIVSERYQQAIAWLKNVQRNPGMIDPDGSKHDNDVNSGIAVMPNPEPNIWSD